ncbi:MAG: ferredoxin [Lapillicoccus sp.]
MPSPSETRTAHRTLPLALDRIACTGHGICASILLEQISLDEWGYPVVHAALVDPALGDGAIRLCPARALTWSRQQAPTEARR